MSRTFTKLFSSITESTIWVANDHHLRLWIYLLAKADERGQIWGSVPGIASAARVPLEQAREALTAFMSPDSESRTKDFEGRRLEEIDGGWRLINHAKYRALLSAEERRENKAQWARDHRAKSSTKVDKRGHLVDGNTKMGTLSTHTEAEADLKSKPLLSGIDPDAALVVKNGFPVVAGTVVDPPLKVDPPKVVFGAAIQSDKGNMWGSIEDLETAQWMHKLVKLRVPSTKQFDTIVACRWADFIRLIRQRDGWPDAEIRRVFEWANKDPFWSANVLSPESLRRHWDKITAKMTAPTPGDLPRLAQWWQTEQGTKTKAQELGVPLRPGEGWSEFRERISAEIERVKNVKIQEGARAKAAARG